MTTPTPETSVAFLDWLRAGRHTITSKHPDRDGFDGLTFESARDDGLRMQIARRHGSRNVYYNPALTVASLNKKPRKSDIVSAQHLWCDIDPRAGEDHAAERLRILGLLTTKLPPAVPAPTCVVNSGNGYQAIWALTDPVALDSAARIVEFERYLRQLTLDLGGDAACAEVSHVMRLPFTVNLPNEQKRKKGRVVVAADIADWQPERIYALSQFKQAPLARAASPSAAAVSVPSGDVQRIADIYELEIPDRLKVIAVRGLHPDEPAKPSRSEWLFDFVCNMRRRGHSREVVAAIITDPDYEISESVLESGDVQRYVQRQLDRADELIAAEPPTLHASTPLVSAREFVKRRRPTLMHYNEDYLAFDGAAYSELEEAQVGQELYHFLHDAQQLDKDGKQTPFNPNKAKVSNVVHALVHETHRARDRYAPPCWLTGDGPSPREIVACRNGLLHLPTGDLLPPTERFFTRNALAFDYAADAAAPTRWLQFLMELWPDEPDSVATLQEMLGYLLIPDTSQQKMFLLVGPPRGGKGTIAHVVQSLVGRDNCCAPTLKSLSDPFGLEPLIGKQLATISDLRMGGMTDHAAVAENLLRISGEDIVSANRKYKGSWHGRLPTRFLILTNVMPRFADASGALANRFVPLILQHSFLGKENHGLLGELLAELPGILLWAVEGWRRLRERGHFEPPRSSREAVEELVDLASPEAAFIKDECELLPGATVAKADLFASWQGWCAAHGQVSPGSAITFSSRVQAAAAGRVKTAKPRTDGRRVPSFAGIRLARRPQQDALPWEKPQ